MILEHIVAGRAIVAAIAIVAAAAVGHAVWGSDDGSAPADAGSDAPAIPCTAVDTAWPTSWSGRTDVEPPQLAILTTDLRPKDAIVLLDRRVAGRARYFNGNKGFLFLEPGRYRLELALDGYRSEVFTIDARPGCRFDLRHRMERDRGAPSGLPNEVPGTGEPTTWIWEPLAGQTSGPSRHPPRGPDPSLRPDLAAPTPKPVLPDQEWGSLKLRVTPTAATVAIDGEFLATGRELDLMVAPLAITAGPHRVEVRAPGYASYRGEVAVAAGEEVTLSVSLEKDAP